MISRFPLPCWSVLSMDLLVLSHGLSIGTREVTIVAREGFISSMELQMVR